MNLEKIGLKMTSREIAELTGKQHAHIMRDIRIEIEKLNSAGIFNESIFGLVKYEDLKGEMRDEYELSRDGVMMLAMKYDTVTRYKITQKLNELESKKVPQSYAQALLEAGRLALELEKVELENKVQKQLISEYEPKVTYYDKILQSINSVNISQVAKDYGISGKELNDILNQEKVQYKQNGQWLLYSKYQDLGYTKSVTGESNGFAWIRSKWTQKGRLFIHALLEKRNIHALEDLQN